MTHPNDMHGSSPQRPPTPAPTTRMELIQMPQHSRKSRSAAEAGFVLPTAIIVLLVLTLLTGAAITVATQTSSSTKRDNNSKAALEAAEAGLQVAAYRLSQIKPEKTECINGSSRETPGSILASPKITYCASSPVEPLGNGATFQYQTSLPLESGANCVGQVGEIKTGNTPRCVVAEGKVANVAQRLSTRVESEGGASLFPAKGIVGLTEVKVSGSVSVPAVVASNERIIGGGGAAFERGFELCPPKGTFKPAAGAERNASGVTVGGVGGMLANPPLEKTRTSGCLIEAPYPLNHATALVNEDSRIGKEDEFFTGGKAVNKFTGAPNFELKLSSISKLTLGGSKYYLCNFEAERAGELIIPAKKTPTEIFIDSPEDKAGTCPAGTGKFETAEFTLNNKAGPGLLLIDLYGKGPFNVTRGATFEGAIYAPEAEVKINGGAKFKGGIVGNTVHLENGTGIFEWSEELSNLTNGVPTGYGRKAWGQCAPGSSPNQGC
jgi:Tfp pilus assembly protein PilX